jgi:hypothetical protein
VYVEPRFRLFLFGGEILIKFADPRALFSKGCDTEMFCDFLRDIFFLKPTIF